MGAVKHNFFEELLVTGTVEQVISTFNLWAVMVCVSLAARLGVCRL